MISRFGSETCVIEIAWLPVVAGATMPVSGEVAVVAPLLFVAVTLTRRTLPTSAEVSGVGRAGRAGDVGAVTAGSVAALPLVGVGDRVRPGPAALVDGERAAFLRRAGDAREPTVFFGAAPVACDDVGRPRGSGAGAGAVRRGDVRRECGG